ncbi:hypothetical protein DN062_03385 [Nitrincola tibetensis]|uniref:Uncharacterized protein n=1 Tax=Nitrincola tibetensis TaxID=2219697 RepID=A0A364NQI4_9GAMM|nr:hypothetical protein [Nitrincola tibetensis]RAU19314.1 hypothetical protein DN062_03385 [Nitrincola tibetensis]
MSDPVLEYLSGLSMEQLCAVELQVNTLIEKRKREKIEKKSEFKIPASPGYNSTEQLANSLGLDISQLMKEVKAWSR